MKSNVKTKEATVRLTSAKKARATAIRKKWARKLVARLNLRPLMHKGDKMKRPVELIEGLIEQASIVGLIGATASYKSFIATAICASVGAGRKCFGRKTKRGLVFLVSGEGNNGLRSRFEAYAKQEGIKMDDILLQRGDCALSLATDEVASALSSRFAEIAKETGKKVALVCFDPFSKISDGIDENSASDVNAFIHRIDRYFRQKLGATVILVHHTGHGNTERPRGSSAFEAALDTAIVVTRKSNTNIVKVKCRKQKDSAEAEAFELKGCKVTMDTKSGVIESLALTRVAGSKLKRQQVTELLRNLQKDSKKPVDIAAWRDLALKKGFVDTPKAFQRHKEKLVKSRVIRVAEKKWVSFV